MISAKLLYSYVRISLAANEIKLLAEISNTLPREIEDEFFQQTD